MKENTYNYPKEIPLWINLKNLIFLNADPIKVISETVTKFGDTYTVKLPLGSDEFILTENADFIQYVLQKNHRNYEKSDLQSVELAKYVGKGLLTNNGEDWLRQRRLIQPGFKKTSILSLLNVMHNVIQEFMNDLPLHREVGVLDLMSKLAFNIVARCLFSANIEREKLEKISDVVTESQEMFAKEMNHPHLRWWYKLSGEIQRKVDYAQEGREILREILLNRKSNENPPGDLLDMLIHAKYEGTEMSMSDEKILDEMIILFIAGHETTANALTWTFYLLSQHPKEIELLIQEAQSINQNWALLSQAKRSSWIVQESLRLFPPVWALDRIALNEDEFNGFSWGKGAKVYMYLYGLHRNPNFWESPNDFIPDRFGKSHVKEKPYYPFGAGPRLCIGNHFAMLEMQMILLELFGNYRFELSSGKVSHQALVTLRPKGVNGVFSKKNMNRTS